MHAHRHNAAAATQLQAYNLAFEELGLNWRWDEERAQDAPLGPQAVRSYLHNEQPHLLRAYDADFLVEAIEAAKRRCILIQRGEAQDKP